MQTPLHVHFCISLVNLALLKAIAINQDSVTGFEKHF